MKKDYKIGAQILSPTMMECSFYHTDAVLKAIESIRETASKTHEAFSNKLREAPNEALLDARGYNNAISILGSRGSGKTSIIMTLQHILQVGESEWRAGKAGDQIRPENIIMPILMPQDFSDGQSLLSWVIIKLQELAKSVLEKIKSSGCGYYLVNGITSGWATGEQITPYNTLQEYIDNLTASYELRFRNEYRLETMRNDEIYHYMDSVERDSKLVLDMLRLISKLVDCYRFSGNAGSTSAKEPLIFFVIDDLDMAPQRSHEVLNLVLRYLQHPNVVVLCGWNQELFQNHLCIELLKTQGVLNVNSADKNYGFDDVFTMRQRKRTSALDSARRLAMDNLKKAFPPAQRFEIRGLTTKQRAEFPLLSKPESDTDPTDFFGLIENTLLSSRTASPQKEDHVGFLFSETTGRLYIYMRIFDNKCRGMINICKAFERLRDKLITWDRMESLPLTNDIIELLNTILFSTTRFAPYRRGIRDLIKINELVLTSDGGKYDYFCNYNAVESILQLYENKSSAQREMNLLDGEYKAEQEFPYFPSLVIDVYLLLGFMENLIRFLVKASPVMHGGHEFSSALNQINPPIEIDTASDNRILRAIAAAGIQRVPLFPDTSSFTFNVWLLDSYEKQSFSDGQYCFSGANTFCRIFSAIFNLGTEGNVLSFDHFDKFQLNETEWFHTIIDLLSALREDEYNIRRLARYTSLVSQGVFADSLDCVRASNTYTVQSFKALMNDNSFETKVVTDDDMKAILYCLRETDKMRRDFANYLKLRGRKLKGEPKNLLSTVKKAALYAEVIHNYTEKRKTRWIEPSMYRQKLNRMNANFKEADENDIFDDVLVAEARDLANENISLLLFNLRRRLELALCENYKKQSDLATQYRYLIKASSALRDYLRNWELLDLGWTQEDANAANDLLSFLRENLFDEVYSDMRKVAQFGPELATGKREQYNALVESIKKWLLSRLDNFSKDDKARIANDLDILTKAPDHIRRALIIEDDLYNLIKEFGNVLAEGCAEAALALWRAKSNAPVIWPIEGNSRVLIEGYYTALLANSHDHSKESLYVDWISTQNGIRKTQRTSTLFDSYNLM